MQVSDEKALENIAENLRRLRGERSLSEVARGCDSYPANIQRIEREENMPGAGLLTRIAAYFGVSVEEMLASPTKGKKLSRSA
jgi:transcriptional regulator with XRE-family HTH domain